MYLLAFHILNGFDEEIFHVHAKEGNVISMSISDDSPSDETLNLEACRWSFYANFSIIFTKRKIRPSCTLCIETSSSN